MCTYLCLCVCDNMGIIHSANLPAHFPGSRKSRRLYCMSCKLAFCLTKILLSTSLLFFSPSSIGSMNIKIRMADNTVKAGAASFHIKPRTKGRYFCKRDTHHPYKHPATISNQKENFNMLKLSLPLLQSPNPAFEKHTVGPLINVTLPVLLESPSSPSSSPPLFCNGPPCFVLSPHHEVTCFLHLLTVF